jgi:hypothetical protein
MGYSFHLEQPGQRLPEGPGPRIFVDGNSPSYREGLDIELSHWNPNNTPDRYYADTSTEIALNFLRFGEPPREALVVNNHLDVDGVLSTFVLLEPELALEQRERLVAIAETGDFWAWAPDEELAIYQGLVHRIRAGEAAGMPEPVLYADCLKALPELLDLGIQAADLRAVHECRRRVEQGLVRRRLVHHRFVQFIIRREAHGGDLDRALRIAEFNASLDDSCLLRGIERNRLDAERVQLVSVETEGGWYHDLYYPGYMWALTINRWRAPGFWEGESSNTWYFRYAPLEKALDRLRQRERGEGSWQSAEELTAFGSVLGRAFPVVASFLGEDDQPAISSLPPETVAHLLCLAYTWDQTARL